MVLTNRTMYFLLLIIFVCCDAMRVQPNVHPGAHATGNSGTAQTSGSNYSSFAKSATGGSNDNSEEVASSILSGAVSALNSGGFRGSFEDLGRDSPTSAHSQTAGRKVTSGSAATSTTAFFSSNQRSLPAVKVDPSGNVYTTQILKQQLANELMLPLRDLRIVDPSFPSQIQATFCARPNAILFTIENIKVVVKHDEALIFSPFQSEVREFIPALKHQISLAAMENSDRTAADESKGASSESGAMNSPSMTSSIDSFAGNDAISRSGNYGDSTALRKQRFEHIVIEASLNVVCSNLFRKVRALSPAVASALNGLRAESRGLDVIQTQVDELLPLKNRLDELRKRVKEIGRAITEVLDSDEDMTMMYLPRSPAVAPAAGKTRGRSRQIQKVNAIENELSKAATPGAVASQAAKTVEPELPSQPSTTMTQQQVESEVIDTMNLEMMLENYLNEIGWIASEIDEVLDTIINTEENVVLQLDLLRNRILKFELTLSILSFVVGCGALVTGLFGMNLLSNLENHPNMFYIVSFLLAAGMISVFRALVKFGTREKLF